MTREEYERTLARIEAKLSVVSHLVIGLCVAVFVVIVLLAVAR